MKTILIYGSKGWIGEQFIEILSKNTNFNYHLGVSRVDDICNVRQEITKYSPTHIISLIGRTHGSINGKKYPTIDYLEQTGKLQENVRDNLFSPLALAIICQQLNIHLTYLGTGCIFSYDNSHSLNSLIGFKEDDEPNFVGSSYSIVKGFTDRLMHLFPENVLNLRIRMPITKQYHPRNFITKITSYDKICSISNSMTILPDLLPLIPDMLLKNITGTFNFTNPGVISHNQILELYKEIVEPKFKWENFTIEEQRKILSSERSNNYLDTSKLQQLYPKIPNIQDSIRNILVEYKKTIPFQSLSKSNIRPHNLTNTYNITNTNENNLLVTGGCGFIGSNFINKIMELYSNITIINIDALYYCANTSNILEKWRNSERYHFIKGNICSQDLINYILTQFKITHIIHFAAQSHVQNSFNDSLQYTTDNIIGTHTLLESVRLYHKLKLFIHVSTDEVYGESTIDKDDKKTEQSILLPTNPYAATKGGAELLCQSYIYSFNLPIIITRGNNVYGPNQYPEKVIPKFIELLTHNQKITIQGDGSCVRAFIHSHDTSSAFIKILEKGVVNEIYNIGCDDNMEYSILDLAKILIKKIKHTEDYESWIEYIEDRPFNDKRYYISNNKIKQLGWVITIDLEKGLDLLLNKSN